MQHPYVYSATALAALRKLWIPGLLLAVVLTAYSCGGSDSSPTSPGGGGGTTKELNSGNLAPGATYAHVFAKAGDYAYHCNFHAVMKGTVQVSNSAPSSDVQVNIVSMNAPFPSATVKPGGKVTWTNNDGTTHTVTSD